MPNLNLKKRLKKFKDKAALVSQMKGIGEMVERGEYGALIQLLKPMMEEEGYEIQYYEDIVRQGEKWDLCVLMRKKQA